MVSLKAACLRFAALLFSFDGYAQKEDVDYIISDIGNFQKESDKNQKMIKVEFLEQLNLLAEIDELRGNVKKKPIEFIGRFAHKLVDASKKQEINFKAVTELITLIINYSENVEVMKELNKVLEKPIKDGLRNNSSF